jgi:hypothetical protein
MMTRFRVGLRLQRFEIMVLTMVVAVLAGSALLVRIRLDALGVPTACLTAWFGGGAPNDPCTSDPASLALAFRGISDGDGEKVLLAMAVVPLLVGMFIGVDIVAREIEGGTAPAMWVLARSRSRWLAGRLLPALMVTSVLLALLATAAEILWAGRAPWEPALRFDDASLHGPVIVAKGLAAFGVAALVGAIIGRSLPAVITATLVIWIGLSGTGTVARSFWMQAEARHHVVVTDPSRQSLAFPGGQVVETGWRTADGRDLDWETAWEKVPAGELDPDAWLAAHMTQVYWGVPGTMYPTWNAAETAGYGAAALLAIGATFLVVRRRRPF